MYRCILIVGAIFLVYAHAHNLLEGASCEDRGVQGTCRQAQLCPSYGLLANSQDHSKVTLCSPDGAPVVVCCTDCYVDDVSKAEVTLNGIVWKTGGDRKSYDKCVEFAARLPYPCKDGKKAAPKKVYDAEKKCHRLDVDVEDVAAAKKERVDFPSLVLLGYVHNATQPPRWQCQGFIISERFVLSTAHCSRDLNAGPPWVLAAGVARRPSEGGAPAAASWQLYRVKRYITHPEWNGRSKYNYIGLLETETDIKFGVDVLPMCLSELASPAAVEADVLGVGTEDNQKVKIEKLDEAECSKQFPSYRSLQNGINFATQACYKGFNESVSSCRNKMKFILVVCLVTLFCGALAKNKKTDDKVKIAVYYESLCPDSKRFITQQLAPVWRDFRGAIKVKMVPYGKSTHNKVDGKWQFICHHGTDECYGNKMQSCILKDKGLQDVDKMELVICLMGQASPDKSLDTCLTQVNKQAESDKIKRCAAGEQGDNLLAAYGDKTAKVLRPLAFVPTVVINEKFDQAVQEEAFTNLKAVVCRVATNKPAAC